MCATEILNSTLKHREIKIRDFPLPSNIPSFINFCVAKNYVYYSS